MNTNIPSLQVNGQREMELRTETSKTTEKANATKVEKPQSGDAQ